jgi:hypothetical protein
MRRRRGGWPINVDLGRAYGAIDKPPEAEASEGLVVGATSHSLISEQTEIPSSDIRRGDIDETAFGKLLECRQKMCISRNSI